MQKQVYSLKTAPKDSREKSTHTYQLLRNKRRKNACAQASKFSALARLSQLKISDLPKVLQDAKIATQALSDFTDAKEQETLMLNHRLDLANAEVASLMESLAKSQKQVHRLQNKLMRSAKLLSKVLAKGAAWKDPRMYSLLENGAYTPAA